WRASNLSREAIYAAISPSGGAMTLVDHPMTWSPLNRMPLSGSAKHKWFEVCPGVCTASKRHFPPTISAPSVTTMSGAKSQSPPSSTPASPRCGGLPALPVRAGRIRRRSRGERECRQPWRVRLRIDPAPSLPFRAGLVEPSSPTRGGERRGRMKIKLDIDCTPEELRSFFGLPDVRPMQEELLKNVQERLSANLKTLDPETMLKTWLPAGLKGFEQLQEMFMSQMAGRSGGGKK